MKKRKHLREELETNPMSNVTERADNYEEPFLLLPEDILIAIFNKVADLKCLLRWSLVSKHFASVILHVQTVSLSVSGNGPYTQESFTNMGKLECELYKCTREQIPSLLDTLNLQNLKLPDFLQKLGELKSISLDYEYLENNTIFPFPTRKIKFFCNSIKMERFVGVVPRYVHKDTEIDIGEEQYPDDYESACERIVDCTRQFFGHYMEWMCRILMLAKSHTSLQRVTITDSEVNGKLVVGRDQFFNNRELLEEMVNSVTSCMLTIAWVPVLHLPSGYVLRWSTLVIINVPEDPLLVSKNWDEIMKRDYDDKLMVLREAVTEIFRNHADKIRLGQSLDIENN